MGYRYIENMGYRYIIFFFSKIGPEVQGTLNEYTAVGNYNNITITVFLRNDGNKNGYKLSVITKKE